ncbi:MAG: type IV pilus assembly protein PilM [Candidatus Magasanikbacteria bacterium]|nr:type IV pilus assembly protein PilM [Candidatus Magasanikbacteria bacterium]
MFHTPFPNAFGININDLSIKVVQFRNTSFRHRKPTYELVTARTIRLPYGLIVNGEIQEPEPVRKYIQHILEGLHKEKQPINSPWVVASLPEKQSFVKLITLPKHPFDILDDDIRIAAAKHVPFEDSSYYIDWEIMDTSTAGMGEETTVLIGVTNKQISNSYTYLLESVGLGVVALEIESLALARALVNSQKTYSGEARALIDIGASKTTLIMYDKGIIQFSRVLDYSGEIVSTSIAQALHMPQADAEKIKKLTEKKQGGKLDAVHKTIIKTTAMLIHDIEESLHFYYSHFKDANRVQHITLTGGGAAVHKLPETITQKLQIQTVIGNPWKNVSAFSVESKIPLAESLSYAAGIGLALRAADNPFVAYDMI